MTYVKFTLRNGEDVWIDPKEVEHINSSREDGGRCTMKMRDGTIYKLANSFANVMHQLGIKMRDSDEI